MRMAAAEARRVLVAMAADKLGVPADQLTVTDGVVHASGDAAKKISYADLIGGQFFNVHLDWNGKYGNPLYAPGKAKPKDPKDHKSSASRSSATTSRRRFLRRPISAPTSRFRAWCTAG